MWKVSQSGSHLTLKKTRFYFIWTFKTFSDAKCFKMLDLLQIVWVEWFRILGGEKVFVGFSFTGGTGQGDIRVQVPHQVLGDAGTESQSKTIEGFIELLQTMWNYTYYTKIPSSAANSKFSHYYIKCTITHFVYLYIYSISDNFSFNYISIHKNG